MQFNNFWWANKILNPYSILDVNKDGNIVLREFSEFFIFNLEEIDEGYLTDSEPLNFTKKMLK